MTLRRTITSYQDAYAELESDLRRIGGAPEDYWMQDLADATLVRQNGRGWRRRDDVDLADVHQDYQRAGLFPAPERSYQPALPSV